MRAVVTFLAIKVVVHLTVNLLQLAIVYLIATTIYSLGRRGTKWTFRLTVACARHLLATTRTAKAKTKKLVATLPPPSHQRYIESPIESPIESDVPDISEPEDELLVD